MKKFFKALALVLALTLVIGTIPAAAAEDYTMKYKTKKLYVGTARGYKVEKDEKVYSKYLSKISFAKAIVGIDSKAEAIEKKVTAKSSDETVIKVQKSKARVKAVGIGQATVTYYVGGALVGSIDYTVKKTANDGTVWLNRALADTESVVIGKAYEVSAPRSIDKITVDTDERRLYVTDKDGNKVDEKIAVVTPVEGKERLWTVKFLKLGEYVVVAEAYQSDNYDGATGVAKHAVTVKNPTLTKVKETANNVVTLYFDDDASSITKDDIDLYYLTATNTKIHDKVIKSVKASEDGTSVAVEIYSTFTPKVEYCVTVGETTEKFTAKSAGVENIARFEIVESQIAVGSIKTVTYKFYDEDDMLITGVVPSDLTISKVSGPDTAFATGQNNVYLAKAGDTMVVKATYTTLDANYDTVKHESPEKTIVGVDAFAAATINRYSVTGDATAIGTSTTPNHIVKLDGSTYILHVLLEQASNVGGNASYTDISANANYTIESVDETKLVVSNKAAWQIKGVAAGTGVILLKDKAGNAVGAFEIEVKPASYLDTFDVTINKTSFNTTGNGDSVVIKATAKDQYGETLKVAGKTFTLAIKGGATKINGAENGDAALNFSTNADGVATFTITGATAAEYPSAAVLTIKTQRQGGDWASIVKNVGLTIVTAGTTASSYAFNTSDASFDMAVTGDTKNETLGKTITVQLEGYKDGYFTGNASAAYTSTVPQSAATGSAVSTSYKYVVTKNGNPISGDDLTGFTFQDGKVVIKPFAVGASTGSAITKMKTGTYVVTAYKVDVSAGQTIAAPIASTSVTINDNQKKPSLTQAKDNVATSAVTASSGVLTGVDASWYTIAFNGNNIANPTMGQIKGEKDATTQNVVITGAKVRIWNKEGDYYVELDATGLPIVIHNK
ncbi:MAG: hypothetical protein K6E62_06730 [Lachnospiraceae bacterium]|nr:hypothetical protein [Lachnospiraceae bacterium]